MSAYRNFSQHHQHNCCSLPSIQYSVSRPFLKGLSFSSLIRLKSKHFRSSCIDHDLTMPSWVRLLGKGFDQSQRRENRAWQIASMYFVPIFSELKFCVGDKPAGRMSLLNLPRCFPRHPPSVERYAMLIWESPFQGILYLFGINDMNR
jgi:hypothetical protein